jgi:hypothetical protein
MVGELKVIRKEFTTNSIIGELYVNGQFFCYTLEDVNRDLNNDGDLKDVGEKKVDGETAIPKGTYEVIVNMSNRFKKMMPLLLNVEGFEGIRIHAGNAKKDTHGCILVGATKSKDFIGNSVVTFERLMRVLKMFDKIQITIENGI